MNLHGTGPPEGAQGFWGLLTHAQQDALQALGRISVFPPGVPLCVEGEPATHLFVLVDGWVKIVSVTRDGQELVLALRGHGDITGEFAGETTGYRSATIRAIGTVRSLIVGYERFSSFLDAEPGASHAYRRVVTQRWRDAATLLRSRSVTTGAQRLAWLLIELAGQHGRPVDGGIHLAMPLSQEDLASLAGTSRATVTRALANWRERGFIRTGGQRRLLITDLTGLRQAAGPRT
jgi:CRP/FNR family transcriptional regulator, cyclic AMP receptor protein